MTDQGEKKTLHETLCPSFLVLGVGGLMAETGHKHSTRPASLYHYDCECANMDAAVKGNERHVKTHSVKSKCRL